MIEFILLNVLIECFIVGPSPLTAFLTCLHAIAISSLGSTIFPMQVQG